MKLSIENIESVGESNLILLNKYLFNLNKVTTYQTHVKTNIYISIMFILHILILSVLKLKVLHVFSRSVLAISSFFSSFSPISLSLFLHQKSAGLFHCCEERREIK